MHTALQGMYSPLGGRACLSRGRCWLMGIRRRIPALASSSEMPWLRMCQATRRALHLAAQQILSVYIIRRVRIAQTIHCGGSCHSKIASRLCMIISLTSKRLSESGYIMSMGAIASRAPCMHATCRGWKAMVRQRCRVLLPGIALVRCLYIYSCHICDTQLPLCYHAAGR